MEDVSTQADVRASTRAPDPRPCPLCRAPSAGAAVVKKAEHRQRRYDIVRCPRCAFVFVRDPRDSTVSDEDVAPERVSVVPPKRRHHQTKNLLDHCPSLRGRARVRVVEIGAGTGPLGRVLGEADGYAYLGFEPSEGRAAVGQRHGVEIVTDLFSVRYLDAPADVVVVDNVLEHVAEPRALIEDAARALRTGGVVVVIVPNFYDVRRFIPSWRERHYWQPHCHINYFTARHLRQLFNETGFSFHHFGLRALDLPEDVFHVPKVLLDQAGLPIAGLYCYGIKR